MLTVIIEMSEGLRETISGHMVTKTKMSAKALMVNW